MPRRNVERAPLARGHDRFVNLRHACARVVVEGRVVRGQPVERVDDDRLGCATLVRVRGRLHLRLARHGSEPSRTGVCRKERARRTTGVASFPQGRRYWRTETVDAPAGFAQGKCKLIQINQGKKLSFPLPNRGFSIGYGESK